MTDPAEPTKTYITLSEKSAWIVFAAAALLVFGFSVWEGSDWVRAYDYGFSAGVATEADNKRQIEIGASTN